MCVCFAHWIFCGEFSPQRKHSGWGVSAPGHVNHTRHIVTVWNCQCLGLVSFFLSNFICTTNTWNGKSWMFHLFISAIYFVFSSHLLVLKSSHSHSIVLRCFKWQYVAHLANTCSDYASPGFNGLKKCLCICVVEHLESDSKCEAKIRRPCATDRQGTRDRVTLTERTTLPLCRPLLCTTTLPLCLAESRGHLPCTLGVTADGWLASAAPCHFPFSH